MDIKGIIAISGKPGLFKVAAQGRNNIIVQSLENNKKFPAFASDKISALEDICIYTVEEEVPLLDVYTKLAKKEAYKKSISHKESPEKLREHLSSFLPDFDEDRVYNSDIKKLFQWYNILVDKGIIVKETKEEKTDKKKDTKKPAAKATTAKKASAKPPAKGKGGAKKSAPGASTKAKGGMKNTQAANKGK